MASSQDPSGTEATVHYDVAFTVLSILTSLVGCVTTLELLHRRTSTKGLFNWFLLLGACVAMGGCGIWSMHFIANRAVVLNHGEPEVQIMYSPGFTAFSVFLPIIVLLAAFYFLGGNNSKPRPLHLLLAAVLTGTAVCGMHYVGNAGIRNYHCTYDAAKVAGAAVIAVAASLVALSIFFRLRAAWTNSWWKRAACAVVLASAVCGMHWTAAVGTHYMGKGADSPRTGTTGVQTVIVCAVLSIGCCMVLLTVAFVRGQKMRLTRTRAQQLVLACAYFDESGRVMVTPEGTFPCQKITNTFIEKTFGEDELSRSHPTFLWIFRASRNWTALKNLIPVMVERLDSDPLARNYRPGHHPPTSDASSEASANFSNIFKQLFCIAADHLSHIVHAPLDDLGVLFEEALETGTTHLLKQKQHRQNSTVAKTDIEAKPFNLGRGKYLFLNRQLSKAQVDKYAALGYRFASTQQVSDLLARNMEVTSGHMMSRLERMKACTSGERLPPPGVHLACFMVRPSVYKSFDVLVPAMTQNQLPIARLKIWNLTDWHTNALKAYDEWIVKDILDALVENPGEATNERYFKFQFHTALLELIDSVGDVDVMLGAVFSARHIRVPCRRNTTVGVEGGDGDECTFLTVRLMNKIHAKPPPGMIYVPLNFFGTQQVVEAGGLREKERWERRIKREFGYAGHSQRTNGLQSSPSPWGDGRANITVKGMKRILKPWSRQERMNNSGAEDIGRVSEDETRIVKTVEVTLREEDGDEADERGNVNGHSSEDIGVGVLSGVGGGSVSLSGEVEEFEKRGRYTATVMTGNGAAEGVEMVEIEAGERGGWVSEVFGMFRL